MFEIPRPNRYSPSTRASGRKPRPASQGSRPEYDVSMCPLNISVLPPPRAAPRADDVRPALLDLLPLHVQAHVVEDARHVLGHRVLLARRAGDVDEVAGGLDQAAAVDLDRPSALPHLASGRTCSENSRSWPRRSSPQSSSMTCVQPASRYSLDRRDAVLRRSGDRPALVEDLVGDRRLRREPAAPLHRLGDGPDLVLRQPGALEQRVRGSLDVLHLVREVHAGDLPGAVPAPVAILVDRGDDRAAEVERVGVAAGLLELPAHVADERRRRDRGGEQPVRRLRRRAQHHRPGAGEVDRHVPARARPRRPSAPERARRRPCPRRRAPRRRARRGRSAAASFIAATGLDSTAAWRMKIFETPRPR